jgi:predicted nucleotidyltransferase
MIMAQLVLLRATVGICLQVQRAVRDEFPHAQAVLFGSQVNGMALPNSDLDIAILNAVPNLISRFAPCVDMQ